MPNPQNGRTACLTSQNGRIACLSPQDGGKACLTPRIEHCMPLHPEWKIQDWGLKHTSPHGSKIACLTCRRKTACLTSQEEDCMPYIAGGRLHASRRRLEDCISAPQQDGRLHALTRWIRDCMTRWKNACLRVGNGS
jgi:hypothetical protein